MLDATHLCKNSCLISHEAILLLRELETDCNIEKLLVYVQKSQNLSFEGPKPIAHRHHSPILATCLIFLPCGFFPLKLHAMNIIKLLQTQRVFI